MWSTSDRCEVYNTLFCLKGQSAVLWSGEKENLSHTTNVSELEITGQFNPLRP